MLRCSNSSNTKQPKPTPNQILMEIFLSLVSLLLYTPTTSTLTVNLILSTFELNIYQKKRRLFPFWPYIYFLCAVPLYFDVTYVGIRYFVSIIKKNDLFLMCLGIPDAYLALMCYYWKKV